MIHLSISLCFLHLNKKKIVRQLLLMDFCDNISKNKQFLSQIPIFHQTSVENLGELILLSKKNMDFKVLVIVLSHSKLSQIQRNQTSPNRWGRPAAEVVVSMGTEVVVSMSQYHCHGDHDRDRDRDCYITQQQYTNLGCHGYILLAAGPGPPTGLATSRHNQ